MPLLEGRIASTSLKKVEVSASQVAQALLQGHTRDFTQKGGFFLLFERGQSTGKLLIRQPLARLLVGSFLQAKGPIVHIARTAEGAGEDAPLLVRWIKAVAIGAFDLAHTQLFSHTGGKPERPAQSTNKGALVCSHT